MRNLKTQSRTSTFRILGPCGNDRIFNINSINTIFYYILKMEMKSQSLSNVCMEPQAPARHNNLQVHLLQLIHLFFSHSITWPEMQDKVLSLFRYICHATKMLPYLVYQLVAQHCLNACNISTLLLDLNSKTFTPGVKFLNLTINILLGAFF